MSSKPSSLLKIWVITVLSAGYLSGKNQENQQTINDLKSRANVYWQKGDIAQAAELHEKILIIKESNKVNSPECIVDLTIASQTLVQDYILLGRYSDAERIQLRLIDESNAYPEYKASDLSNLGAFYLSISDYESAATPLLDGLKFKLNGFAGKVGMVAEFEYELNNAAAALYESGQYERAANLCKSGINLLYKNHGDSGPFNKKFLNLRSILVRSNIRLGKIDENTMILDRMTHALNEWMLPSTIKNEDWNLIKNLGYAFLESGKYSEAKTVFKGALPKADSLPQGGEIYDGLCWSMVLENDPERVETTDLVKQSTIFKNSILPSINLFSERKRLLWEQTELQFDLPSKVLTDDEYAEVLLAWKGVTLDSVLADAKKNEKINSSTDKSFIEAINKARADYEAALFSKSENLAGKEKNLKDLEMQLLAQSCRSNRALFPPIPKLKDLQKSLKDDEVLLDFTQLTGNPTPGSQQNYSSIIITNKKVARSDNISADKLKQSIDNLYTQLNNGSDQSIEAALAELYDNVYDPISKLIPPDCKKIYICADGIINFIPFSILCKKAPEFICVNKDIAYVTTPRDLLNKSIAPTNKNTIIVFNPCFSESEKPSSMLKSLPGTERESIELQKIVSSNGLSAQMFSGRNADEMVFKKLQSPYIIHIATHGFSPDLSSYGDHSGKRGMQVKAITVNTNNSANLVASTASNAKQLTQAAKRTVLALSGAEDTLQQWIKGNFPNPCNDGILTPSEAATLNLQGTWIVTLSACDSGRGDTIGGEGVFGLRRAFRIAGVQNLIMTLWPVSDDATADIMGEFYRHVLQLKDPASALAVVQGEWLLKTFKSQGLLSAVRQAGPFIAIISTNDHAADEVQEAPPNDTVFAADLDSIEHLAKMADRGNAEAAIKLGIKYAKGDGVPQNISKAIEWFNKAFKSGSSEASIYLDALTFSDHLSPAAQRFRDSIKNDNQKNDLPADYLTVKASDKIADTSQGALVDCIEKTKAIMNQNIHQNDPSIQEVCTIRFKDYLRRGLHATKDDPVPFLDADFRYDTQDDYPKVNSTGPAVECPRFSYQVL